MGVIFKKLCTEEVLLSEHLNVMSSELCDHNAKINHLFLCNNHIPLKIENTCPDLQL